MTTSERVALLAKLAARIYMARRKVAPSTPEACEKLADAAVREAHVLLVTAERFVEAETEQLRLHGRHHG
jgi:hypothetical protein